MTTLLAAALIVPWVAAALLVPLDGRRRWVAAVAVAALAATLAIVAVLAALVFVRGPVMTVAGGWPAAVGIVLRADPLGLLFALCSVLVIGVALAHELMAGVAERRFPALVLFLTAGLNGIFLTGDVFNFYVFFELSMAAGYVITSYRAEQREAGPSLVFAVVNLLGSFVFLIGIATLYHTTGTLEMSAVAARLDQVGGDSTVLIAITFFVAFGVKLGLFPFHFWLPPVYAAAHPAAASILSGALANIGAYGLLRFGGELLERELRVAAGALIAIGVASILYGSLQAIARRDSGEMLAYSSVGQVGYVLVAIGIGGTVGFAAAVIYAIVNALNKGMLFLAAGLRGWLVAGAFAIGAFSIAGVPPSAGFVSKVAVFRGGVEADSALLVALLFAGSALSFLYVFQLYQHRFWEHDDSSRSRPATASPRAQRGLVLAFACLILALGAWPEPLAGGGERAAGTLVEGGP